MHISGMGFNSMIFYIFPWQNTVHETPAARQPHRQMTHTQMPAHLHTVSRLGGKRFRHFDGRSVPKCSFRPCFVGSSLALGSLAVASKWHAI